MNFDTLKVFMRSDRVYVLTVLIRYFSFISKTSIFGEHVQLFFSENLTQKSSLLR